MNATVSDLQKETREVLRAVVQNGEEIILTDSGTPVARIVPYMRTITVSPEEARGSGELTNEAIIAALNEARDDSMEHLDPP